MIDSVLLFLHVIGAAVLLGTGAGIAFFMLISHRSGDPALIAHVSGIVILAYLLFTATAVIAQPLTGMALALRAGWPIFQGWLGLALGLYIAVGLLWLPVVRIQIVLHRLAARARDAGEALPDRYHSLFRIWFACSVPAFAVVLVILWLMLFKPILG